MAIIEVENLSYLYPMTETPALHEVSLQVEEGEFVAIIGPNGAGKSTLCYAISGFVPHFFQGQLTGKVQVAGLSLQDSTLRQWVLNVGLAFQNPFNQISGSKFTVFEEIAFGLENIGVPRDEMITRVEKIMALTGISDLAERSPYSLSGGQQQRVALTSILVMEPKILVLDEPTSQLDPIGTREVFQVIKALSGQGITVVMAEHKIEWVAEFADQVVALYQGGVILKGSPAEVLTSPSLADLEFGLSRYTSTAQLAIKQNLWPSNRRLPIKLQEAIEGFGELLNAD